MIGISAALAYTLLSFPASATTSRTVETPRNSASARTGELEFVSERFGFRLRRPSTAWVAYATDAPPEARFSLTLYPSASQGVPSCVVYVVDADETSSATAVRDLESKKLALKSHPEIEVGASRVANHDAAWLRATLPGPDGTDLVVQYDYLVEGAYIYVLQLARHPAAADEAVALDAIAASLALFAPKVEKVDPALAELDRLAARCGSEIDWCTTWQRAAERAQAESKLVLAVFENFEPLAIPRTLTSGPFMDPDLVALVNERFVAFEMGATTAAPFREPEQFGMGKSSFGRAFLFVDAGGHVLRETGVSNASYLCEFARGVLAELAPEAPASGSAGAKRTEATKADRLAEAELCLRRGELDRAEKLLANEHSPRAHRLRAARLCQLRQGKLALDELRLARHGVDAQEAMDIDVDEALVLMRMGRSEEAETIFERAAKKEPESRRAPEAMFWLGAFDVLQKGVNDGTAWWHKLVESHADDRWAWKAAANLRNQGSFILGDELLAWPDAEVVASVAPVALVHSGKRATSDAALRDRAEREAVAYLVKTQRADGSWINPMDAFSIETGSYTPAITAICGVSLLPHAAEKGVANAIDKALARTLELHASGKLDAGKDLVGVYSIWSRTYALLFCARCVRSHVGDAHELTATMNALVDSIQRSRHANGGWPYVFLPGDPSGNSFDPSASFLTAGVVCALFEARAAGAEVSKVVLDDALRFLRSLRQDDGSFRYMPAVPGERVDGSYPEAAGRGPLCALALLRGGTGDVELVRTALKSFVAHRAGIAKEWGKELCHTSPEGFGVHYIFYDYAFAAEAVRELPRDERAAIRAALLQDVMDARLADGSFVDMPSLGRAYGAAMALWTLRELRAE